MEYKTTRVSADSYKDIQSLKHRSMGYIQEMSEIEKKFNTSNFGKKDIGFFARDDKDFPAAYYGIFPMRVINNGQESIVAQSGDTMTDPDHRKKGLFVKLAKETYDFAGKDGIDFIFGFPNEFSYPGFKKKLDWIFYGEMQEFSIETKTLPLCEFAKKYSFFRSTYIRMINRRLSKYTLKIEDSSIKDFSHKDPDFFVKKDISFYNYKSGDYKYLVNIKGFTMFIKAQTHLYIGDVAKFDDDRLDDFLIALNMLSKLVYSRKIVLTISETHWLFNLLKKKVSPKTSLPIGFYKYSKDFPFEKLILSMSDYDTF